MYSFCLNTMCDCAEEEERKRRARLRAEEEERKRKAKLSAEEEERKRRERLRAEEEERKRKAKLSAEEEERKRRTKLSAEEEERKRRARLQGANESQYSESGVRAYSPADTRCGFFTCGLGNYVSGSSGASGWLPIAGSAFLLAAMVAFLYKRINKIRRLLGTQQEMDVSSIGTEYCNRDDYASITKSRK